MVFQNNTAQVNDIWYESHLLLLKKVCMELNSVDKIQELQDKFLGEKTKLKKRKDPNRPKRPKSSFMFFCDVERKKMIQKLRDSNKKVNIGEITKKLGLKWKELKHKKEYEKLAKKDKERYATQKANYTE